MKNSLKGAFYSGLIFPGLGQIVFKHYIRGIALLLTVSACLTVIIVKEVQQAFAILKIIESTGSAVNMSTISRAAVQVSAVSGNLTFKLLLLLIAVCWIIGIIDAYRIGRKKDIETRQAIC